MPRYSNWLMVIIFLGGMVIGAAFAKINAPIFWVSFCAYWIVYISYWINEIMRERNRE